MIKLLCTLFLAILSILPTSPFQTTLGGEIYKLNFLPYLNWFLPFDNALKITQFWVVGIVAYYMYDYVIYIVKKLIVDKYLRSLS